MRASLYIRVSRKAEETNVSVEGMERQLRAFAAREGYEVLEPVHVDDGVSGAVRERPEFRAWLDDARSGRAEILLAPNASRVTREGVQAAAAFFDVLEGKSPSGERVGTPVRFRDLDGQDSESGAFRLQFVIGAEIARSERDAIISRRRRTVRDLRARGRYVGGSPPFGYRAVKVDGLWTLELEPVEAKAIEDAAQRVLRGESIASVARLWNREGPPPRRAATWHRHTVKTILLGPAVLGRATVVADDADRAGKAVGEAITDAVYPPVISLGLQQAIRDKIAERGAGVTGGRRPTALLTNVLRCHSCGSGLHVAVRNSGRNAAAVIYRCSTRGQGGICERPVHISRDKADAHVVELIAEARDWHATTTRTVIEDFSEELAALRERNAALGAQIVKSFSAELAAEMAEVQEEIARLAAVPPTKRIETVESRETYGQAWDAAEGDLDRRRQIVLSLFPTGFIVNPGEPGKRFDPSRIVAVDELSAFTPKQSAMLAALMRQGAEQQDDA